MKKNKLIGPKDTTQIALESGLISNSDCWMSMIQSRNLIADVYIKKIAADIIDDILNKYHLCYVELKNTICSIS